jgi:hypothetical protein
MHKISSGVRKGPTGTIGRSQGMYARSLPAICLPGYSTPAMRSVAAAHPSLAGDSSLPAVAQWLQTEL